MESVKAGGGKDRERESGINKNRRARQRGTHENLLKIIHEGISVTKP